MNGADLIVKTLVSGGVDTCFANPGTSELHLVRAFDQAPAMRCILGLFEGVTTGAADGYARMAEKPACTLLHLGVGLANGLANLHNAKRAQVPILNLVGQHPLQHLQYDAPLTTDIEAIARPFSSWLRTSIQPCQVARDTAEAIAAATKAPGQIATLIVPADVAWGEANPGEVQIPPRSYLTPNTQAIEQAAHMLRSGVRTALLLGGNALYGPGLLVAGRIAAATGASLLAPYPLTRLQRGAGYPKVERVLYILEQARKQFQDYRQLILVGSAAPAAYFAYPQERSGITPQDCDIHTLAKPGEDYLVALEQLASALSLKQTGFDAEQPSRPAVPSGPITLPGIAAAVGATLPEDAIVVDESMTSGRGLMAATKGCPPHDWLGNTGGSIGIAMPLAIGAAVAGKGRRVLCLTADGSGMYTLQALWTMARENLDVTIVVFANHEYAVLKREFSNLELGTPGHTTASLFEIGRPAIDWTHLARGMGVPARRVDTLDELVHALQCGFKMSGPSLIHIPL